jgi:hypothetical protein
MRARTVTAEIEADLVKHAGIVRQALDLTDPQVDAAWAHLETFCAVAMRVLRATNPSKVRDAAMTEEIKARMDGWEVLEDER